MDHTKGGMKVKKFEGSDTRNEITPKIVKQIILILLQSLFKEYMHLHKLNTILYLSIIFTGNIR
jgi:hypothetical protein